MGEIVLKIIELIFLGLLVAGVWTIAFKGKLEKLLMLDLIARKRKRLGRRV